MKLSPPFRLLASASLIFAALAPFARAQYTNGQPASTILGQASYTTNVAPAPPSASTMKTPQGVAVDPTSGKVFVADTSNNRVLRFGSTAAYANGSSAEYVFGQAAFNTAVAGTTLSGMDSPFGVAIDTSGRLWVADTNNNRVLYFENAASVTASGVAATGSIGGTGTTSNTTFSVPAGLTIVNGVLYVTDRANNRVLRFSSPLTSGAADGLFGQSNFQANTALEPPTQSSLQSPGGVTVDAVGNLWVADTANNRVVRFANAASAPLGPNASLVLGQTSFISNTSGSGAARMNSPAGLTMDPIGRLYVGDFSNNRILVFRTTSLTTSGSAASLVLGQPGFETTAPTVTATGLNNVFGLSFSPSGFLWAADGGSNRLLSYAITPGTPTAFSSPTKLIIQAGKKKSFRLTALNSGTASDIFRLQATLPSTASKKAKIEFIFNGANVNAALKAGSFQTTELLPGQSVVINVKVTARNAAKGKTSPKFTAVSTTSSAQSSGTQTQITFEPK